MRIWKTFLLAATVIAVGTAIGCSTNTTKAPDVAGSIRTSLDQTGLKSVTVSQDRDKGVLTLGGHVAADGDKAQAESIAKSIAGNEVVANQIEVLPVGAEKQTKGIDADVDKGIESNLDAALLSEKLHHSVKYSVKNRVVTLTGDVQSQADRARAARVAGAVLNVQQVVNELQVKAQKASSSSTD
jgi:osmotically-inducible protein OsmY